MPSLLARPRIIAPLLAAIGLFALGGCSTEDDSSSPETAPEDELVGGKPESRFLAAGHLVHGATLDGARRGRVACGATLVAPNVVVTAAHCVLSAKSDVWAFGTGNLGSSEVVKVTAVNVHPGFHEAPTTSLDVRFFLKNFDVATLTLEHPIEGVKPAALPSAKASEGCDYTLIGYKDDATMRGRRVSARGCVLFRVQLGEDPIFEMHPAGSSALCNGDGDEGSPAISGPADAPVVHGIYVGSVTQGITDCRKGTQFLNGYESMFGFREFVEEGIARGQEQP